MNVYHPLPNKPEFSVVEYPGYREFRVDNPKHPTRGSFTPSWLVGFVVPAFFAVFWQTVPRKLFYLVILIYLGFLFKYRFLAVLHESVIILPPHGIQLETHQGFSDHCPLRKKQRFIPAASLADIVINEGIRGWNVLYYLVAVKSDVSQGSSLEVAYEELLPCHAILLQVYEGIHEILLSRTLGYSSLRNNLHNHNHE